MIDHSWNKERYESQKMKFSTQLKNKTASPYDLMQEYKRRVVQDDFEACKAITEVLKPLNYDTADTHAHIKQLNS